MQRKFRRFKRNIEASHGQHIHRLKLWSQHPVLAPATVFVMLCIVSAIVVIGIFDVNLRGQRPDNTWKVIVSYDHKQQVVPSREPTVGDLIHKMAIPIHPGDVVEPALDTRINQNDFRVNVYRAMPVTVVNNGHRIFAYSAATTPRAVAKQIGLNLYPEDQVEAQPVSDFVTQNSIGQVVQIKPSVPINLIVYGAPIVTRTHSDTVADMLSEKHITLHPGDTVQPGLNSAITPNEQVFVLHKGTSIVTETQEVPMPIQYIDDPKLSSGTTAIRQYGTPGAILITYQLDTKTGQKTQLQSVVVQEAVAQIVARGTAPVSGSLATWLYALRMCESHGNYQDNTGNGYYGAYQFSLSTWHRIGYSGYPNEAPPSVQDEAIVKNTNLSKGGLASQNPGCYRKTGISAFPPGS